VNRSLQGVKTKCEQVVGLLFHTAFLPSEKNAVF